MRRAENICRKIKCCHIPFSSEAAIWIQRIQVYYSLLRYHRRKIKNRGNLKRAARRCNIPNPLRLSMQEITQRLETCKKECAFYQEHGKCFCWKHLENRKRIAQEQDDKEAFNKNQRHYSTGASERFLAETKLCHREEENAECHDNTSGRK
jgi:hypothetical protein